ncbi:ABC transporter permease [Spirochaeta dissipatitropha]
METNINATNMEPPAADDIAADIGAEVDKGQSLWSVYLRRFRKHTLGKVGLLILLTLYSAALMADVLSPFSMTWADRNKSYHPPTSINYIHRSDDGSSFRPFVFEQRLVNQATREYGIIPMRALRAITVETQAGRSERRAITTARTPEERKAVIMDEMQRHYRLAETDPILQRLSNEIDSIEALGDIDEHRKLNLGVRTVQGIETDVVIWLAKGNKNFLQFFGEGIPYRFLGMFDSNRHFLTSPTGGFFLMGTDQLGRDLLSRLLHGSRVSLSVGILGAAITFILGIIIGGISGYFGGVTDTILMRLSEIVISFPSLYLLFTLRASFPPGLNSIQVYVLIIMILSLVGWATLARVIRGMVLSIKTEDYVLSARTMGLSDWKIIYRHVLPNTFSYSIIQVTLAIPGFILGEAALSLLGLGISEPQASWGLMLSVARSTRVVQDFPWILIPGFAIFLAILAWNFFGDGIRDSMDPRSKH